MAAQEEEARTKILFGPRLGVTYVASEPDDFDSSIQDIYPSGRRYFPVYSLIGVSFEQNIRLGDTKYYFTFQEIVLIGGLDQNIFLPDLDLLVGFRSPFGLVAGVGPNFSLRSTDGKIAINTSMIYSVGWSFSFKKVNIPLSFFIVPTPEDGAPIMSLVSGFNFNIVD
jgi:hypothetical protein